MIKGSTGNKTETKEISNAILVPTLSFLDPATLGVTARVNKKWKTLTTAPKLWQNFGFNDKSEFRNFLENFPVWCRKIIIAKLTPAHTVKLKALLVLSQKDRITNLFSPDKVNKIYITSNAVQLLSSNVAIMALIFGILSPLQAIDTPSLASEYGIRALVEGLISTEEVTKIPNGILGIILCDLGIQLLRDKSLIPEQLFHIRASQLEEFLIPNCVIALREKLVTAEDIFAILQDHSVVFCNRLKIILSDIGITALREKLITTTQFKLFCNKKSGINSLCSLLTKDGLIALRERLITPEEVCITEHKKLSDILCTDGLEALRLGLTPEQICKLLSAKDERLNLLVTYGKKILREKLISIEQLSRGFSLNGIKELILDMEAFFACGVNLQEGLINFAQIQSYYQHTSSPYNFILRDLLLPNGIVALREKLFTTEQAFMMTREKLSHLLSDVGIQCLRNKILTFEEACKMTPQSLSILLSDAGLSALKNKVITTKKVCLMSSDEVFSVVYEYELLKLTEQLKNTEEKILTAHKEEKLQANDAPPKVVVTKAKTRELPNVIIAQILYYSDPVTICAASINSVWHKQASDQKLWKSLWQKLGFNDKKEFLIFINQFPIWIRRILATRLTLHIKTELQNLLTLNSDQRLAKMFAQDEIDKIEHLGHGKDVKKYYSSNTHLVVYVMGLQFIKPREIQIQTDHYLFNDEGVRALIEGVLTVAQARLFKTGRSGDGNVLGCLLVPNGILALKEKLFTPEQVYNFTHQTIKLLLTTRVMIALRVKLISLEQVRTLCFGMELDSLLSPIGINALREGLITIEQAIKYYKSESRVLSTMLTTHGMTLLKEKLITFEQASKIPSYVLGVLLTDTGVSILRAGFFTVGQIVSYYRSDTPGYVSKSDIFKSLITPNGFKALNEGLISFEQACKMGGWLIDQLLSDPGVCLLQEGLITSDQAILFRHPSPDLKHLLSSNARNALKERLISPEQASMVSNNTLGVLLSNAGVDALRNGVITVEQAKLFCLSKSNFGIRSYETLEYLLGPNGIIALKEKLITPEQACLISPETITALVSNEGLVALRERLITAEQAKLFYQSNNGSGPYNLLKYLFVPNGFLALRTKLITPEQACMIPFPIINELLSDVGLQALQEGVISVNQVVLFKSSLDLALILSPNGRKALSNQLLTIEQASCLSSVKAKALLSDIGITALAEKLITVDQVQSFPEYHLDCFLVFNGLIALREKLITPVQALTMPYFNLKQILTDTGITALREKLITAEKACSIREEVLQPMLTAKGLEELRLKMKNDELLLAKELKHTKPIIDIAKAKIMAELSSAPEKLRLDNEDFEVTYNRNKRIMEWLLFNLSMCPESHKKMMLEDLKSKHPELDKLEENFLTYSCQKIKDELSSQPDKLRLGNEDFESAYHRNKRIMEWLLFNLSMCPESHKKRMLEDLKSKYPYFDKIEENLKRLEMFNVDTRRRMKPPKKDSMKAKDPVLSDSANAEQKNVGSQSSELSCVPSNSTSTQSADTGNVETLIATTMFSQSGQTALVAEAKTSSGNNAEGSNQRVFKSPISMNTNPLRTAEMKNSPQEKIFLDVSAVTSSPVSKKIILEFKRSHGRIRGNISTKNAMDVLVSKIKEMLLIKEKSINVVVELGNESDPNFTVNLVGVCIAKDDKASQKNLKLLLLNIYYSAKFSELYIQDEFIMKRIVSDQNGEGQVITVSPPPKAQVQETQVEGALQIATLANI